MFATPLSFTTEGEMSQHIGVLTRWPPHRDLAAGASVKNLPLAPSGKNDIRYTGSINGLGKSSGEGNDNPLQYSYLENSMDSGVWQATVHGVPKSWTWLSDWTELNWTEGYRLVAWEPIVWLEDWNFQSHPFTFREGRVAEGSFTNGLLFIQSCPHNEFSQFSSVAQSCLTFCDSMEQHTRLPCPSPTPRNCSNSCPSSQWCHPTISSSVIPFSSLLQSFSASGSFPMSQFFESSGQSIGVSASASILPMNIQDWSPLGWTGWISLQSKGLSGVFSNTTVQKNQFFHTLFIVQLSHP